MSTFIVFRMPNKARGTILMSAQRRIQLAVETLHRPVGLLVVSRRSYAVAT